jgi:hypothetical protein
MQKALGDRYKASKMGIKVLNGKDQVIKASQTRYTNDRSEDIVKGVIAHAQAKENLLLEENDQWRNIVRSVRREIEGLLLINGVALDHDTVNFVPDDSVCLIIDTYCVGTGARHSCIGRTL